MIAYLATSITRGRLIARQQHGLLTCHEWPRRRQLRRKDRERSAAGIIATRAQHLHGAQLTGIVLLEPVTPELVATALAQVGIAP